jgi:hypothetical protein
VVLYLAQEVEKAKRRNNYDIGVITGAAPDQFAS